MYKICVFGGTTEGRQLVEFLSAQPVSVTACVATEYGEALLGQPENTAISARRLPKAEIEEMLRTSGFDLLVDATHPYAASITESVSAACAETGTAYLRLLRKEGDAPKNAVFVETAAQAAEYLNRTDGNILLTTGSKELGRYQEIRDFSQRVFVRVLPMQESLAACQKAGVKPGHILAMQGPFSTEMNLAMLKQTGAKVLVTKNGGSTGGFPEKAAAAEQWGAQLVIIGRPPQKAGMDLNSVIHTLCQRFQLSPKPQITVVGIGPGSESAMTKEVSAAIHNADCLIGAKRMVEAVARPEQAVFCAVAPGEIADFIETHPQYRQIAVVMSGDVGFFSGTKKLLPLLDGYPVRVFPGLNSLTYLCAKLGTSYENVVPVSLHGRDHNIVGDVRRHPRVFALVGGENGMNNLCANLTSAGLSDVRISIGERLSYPDEKITAGTAGNLRFGTYDPLSVALIENTSCAAVVTHGLSDEAFQRSGDGPVVPMTKSEVRSVCLSKLQLTRDAICWDVGAGTGSVSIEMALQADSGQVYAIEQKENAVALLSQNKARFGVNNLFVIPGTAPESCNVLPAPTHVFIGGSGGNMRSILDLVLAKNPRARIVATAVSLESVAELTDCMKAYPFDVQEVVSLNVSRAKAAGAYHLMTAQNPVFIFTLQNRGESL